MRAEIVEQKTAIIHGTRLVSGSDDLNAFHDGNTKKASKPMLYGCISILYVD
jgi:hypothetical protein